MSIVVSQFLYLAAVEVRVARGGDPLSPNDQDLILAIFNELLDSLNGDGVALYNTTFQSFTLTAALQPHTIGIAANTPTFTVTTGRPTRILAANLVLTAGTTRVPLNLRDDQWWANIRSRLITSANPTDLYYDTSWPNGGIYLWPVPTTAYGLELEFQTQLAQVLATDTLDLPQGYQAALRLTLAELIAAAFGQSVSADTKRNAIDARARAWGSTNDPAPNLDTRDGGVPSGGGRSTYDYRTGYSS